MDNENDSLRNDLQLNELQKNNFLNKKYSNRGKGAKGTGPNSKSSVKKWSEEEDAQLLKLAMEYNCKRWKEMAIGNN